LASALDSLASEIRSGIPVGTTLSEWHRRVDDDLRPSLLCLGDLLELGQSPAEAFAGGGARHESLRELGRLLVPLLELHERAGGDLAGVVQRTAMSLRACSDEREEARASVAGAKLSARMVAALPLVFLPLAPLGRAPMFDRTGIAILAVGVLLAVVGMRWIGSLIPAPPDPHDPLDRFAREVALSLRSGMAIGPALSASAVAAGPLLASESRRVALGCSWGTVLGQSTDPFLRSMATIVDRGDRLGLPVATSLESLVDQRKDSRTRMFNARLRRAPVLMMVPLTLCVLPSFGFLALGPFLRGLGSG
jgi:tight adherence protein B